MADWSSTMQQSFEYYIVDPGTWKDVKRLDSVIKSTINRDSSAETLGSATIDIVESIGECYIRIYLIFYNCFIKVIIISFHLISYVIIINNANIIFY